MPKRNEGTVTVGTTLPILPEDEINMLKRNEGTLIMGTTLLIPIRIPMKTRSNKVTHKKQRVTKG